MENIIRCSIIETCAFESEYTIPKSGDILYYHSVKFKNGEIRSFGVKFKNDVRLRAGTELVYEYAPGSKKTVIRPISDKVLAEDFTSVETEPEYPEDWDEKKDSKHERDLFGGSGDIPDDAMGGRYKKSGKGKIPAGELKKEKKFYHKDHLGYCFSYAKDLLVAGKLKTVEEMISVAKKLYDEMGDILSLDAGEKCYTEPAPVKSEPAPAKKAEKTKSIK